MADNRIQEVGVVMLPVSDQDQAIEFYTEKLGFELRSDTPFGEGERWVEVAPAGAATRIALVPGRGDVQPGGEARIGLRTADARAEHDALAERGVDVGDLMDMGEPVPPMFSFRDQDKNNVLVVQQP